MPGKGRRVASRQAQLRQKRSKESRGPIGTPTGTPTADPTPPAVGTQTDGPAPAPKQTAAPVPQSRPAVQPVPASPSRPPARSRTDRPLAYSYIRTELRRILILSGIVIVALIVLGILL